MLSMHYSLKHALKPAILPAAAYEYMTAMLCAASTASTISSKSRLIAVYTGHVTLAFLE